MDSKWRGERSKKNSLSFKMYLERKEIIMFPSRPFLSPITNLQHRCTGHTVMKPENITVKNTAQKNIPQKYTCLLSLEPGNWPRVCQSTSNLLPPTLRNTVLSGSLASVSSWGAGTGLGPVPPISLFLDKSGSVRGQFLIGNTGRGFELFRGDFTG